MNKLFLRKFFKKIITLLNSLIIKLKHNLVFARILRIFGVPVLYKIFICPSHQCNANCVHCYEKFIHESFKKFLTTEQIRNIIDQFYQLGGSVIFFCSGEFLLRDDALDLIRYARSKNINANVVTNGLLLDEEKIKELKNSGLSNLIVSIDSAEAAKHNEYRGVPGCFEKAVNGIRLAKKNDINAEIWTYVTKTNFNGLAGISKLGKELGVNIFTFFPLLSGNLFNKFDENLTYEDRERFRKQYNHSSNVTLEFSSEKGPCRGGGLEHISVMPSGDVTFCPPVPYSYGNIDKRLIKDCLKDIIKDHRRFSKCRGQCIVNFVEYRQNCNAEFMY